MHERNEAILELSKLCRPIRVTATGPVILGPCFLFSVHFSADAVGVTTNQIHRGPSVADPVLFDLDTLTSSSFQHNFDPPVYFPRGIYVAVGLNLQYMVLHILELKT